MFVFELGEWAKDTYGKSAKPLLTKLRQEYADEKLGCLLQFRSHSVLS